MDQGDQEKPKGQNQNRKPGKVQEANRSQQNKTNNRPKNNNANGVKYERVNQKVTEKSDQDQQNEQKPIVRVQTDVNQAVEQKANETNNEVKPELQQKEGQDQQKPQKRQQRQNHKENENKKQGDTKDSKDNNQDNNHYQTDANQDNKHNTESNKDNKDGKDNKVAGVCRLFKAGKCFYGDNCKFRHGKVKVGLDKLCKLFLDQGKCKFDKKCHFVHMSKEEWEAKYRHSQPEQKQQIVKESSGEENSNGEEEEEKDDFEYKSKIQLKKEKQKRLAEEHKAHKEHIQKAGGKSNSVNSTLPVNKDTKMPNVEYFDPETFDKEFQENDDVQTQQPKEEEEKKEIPWFDLEMIEQMGKKSIDGKVIEVVNKRKFKPWIDISKTENGKLTTELNNRALFKNDYIGYVKSLNDNYSRDLGQVQRSYMSTFKWIQKNHMFEIQHTPTCKKENLPINFDITEGYFRLRIALDPKGLGTNTQYQVLNTSIPEEIVDSIDELLNNIHQAQSKSIFRTLKYFDNNLEKVFKGAYDLIQNQKEQEREDERKRLEEEERQKLLEQKKLEAGSQEDNEEEEEDGDEEEGDDNDDEEEYDECEDPYFNQNDEENNDQESEGEIEEEEEKGDPTIDLDLNMHCSLKDLQMRRIAHLRVNSLVVQVKCKSCKYDTELTLCNFLDGTKDNVLVNNLICVSCNRIAAIYCSREFVCSPDLNLAFRVGSFTWHILDIRQVSYNVTCEGCNTSKVVENYVAGTQHNSDCHSCFKNLSFIYFSFKIEKKIDEEYLNRVRRNAAKARIAPTTSLRPKKIGTFKAGEPLPKNGACSHYRHSYRLFRFPCCGKAFPCDICHDQGEKHEQILAKTMICGFCSREQSIKQECSSCKKMLVRISSNSGYWEGGKGTRNHTAMSKSDNHKYSGQSKTISRRKIKKENMQKK